MERSESISELTKSLIKFQADVKKVLKDSTNPFFNSKYAQLSTIQEVIKPFLVNNNLGYVQMPVDNFGLETMIFHGSGEYMSATYFMSPENNKPQTIGSCLTYQRRYALCSVLGLITDDFDDDANKATGLMNKVDDFITDDNLQKLHDWEKKHNKSCFDLLRDYYKMNDKEVKTIMKSLGDYEKRKNIVDEKWQMK